MSPDTEVAAQAVEAAFRAFLVRWSEIAGAGRTPTEEERAHLAALRERLQEAYARFQAVRAGMGLPDTGLEVSGGEPLTPKEWQQIRALFPEPE